MAYLDEDNEGYYSNVAVVKYTSQPTVTIDNLLRNTINANPGKFIGKYQQSSDTREKVYKYIFNIYDDKNNLYATSGEQLHNSYEDTAVDWSIDTFNLNKDLIENQVYTIEYKIITNNQLEESSGLYQMLQQDTINPDIKVNLIATNHRDNGYIELTMKPLTEEVAAAGSYDLKRASSKDGYSVWHRVYNFQVSGINILDWSWRDYTVEQGVSYQYAIQQYNENLVSNKIKSNEVTAQFDDMFLFDGEKQLKIQYNPKVTSFKTVIQETKSDTIGSKYPFFYRNQAVNYKEFPISGLISYLMDDEELFAVAPSDATMNLTDENVASERAFKLNVLDWLNNGELKVFRSPAEGNYVVRLMNVSLSPTDTLGRMLHTFSATAYEACDFDYNSLLEKGFYNLDDGRKTSEWTSASIDLVGRTTTTGQNIEFAGRPAYIRGFRDISPRTEFIIDGTAISIEGDYSFFSVPVETVVISNVSTGNAIQSGFIDYDYEHIFNDSFEKIADIQHARNWEFRQIIGPVDNVLNKITDKKVKMSGGLYKVRFVKRPVEAGTASSDLSLVAKQGEPESIASYGDGSLNLYRCGDYYYKDETLQEQYMAPHIPTSTYNIIPITLTSGGVDVGSYDPSFTIDGTRVDLRDTNGTMTYDLLENIGTITLGNGVYMEFIYMPKMIIYNVESQDRIDDLQREYDNYFTIRDAENLGNNPDLDTLISEYQGYVEGLQV